MEAGVEPRTLSTMWKRLLRSALAVAIVSTTRLAVAQPSGQDVATAQALFDEGKRLMQEKKYDDACPKLVESQRLDPGGGTLLAIALCHEGQGKSATAWAEFGIALGEARKDRRTDRESAALEHIRALEPKLTRVKVTVANKPEGLEIRRDGAKVGEAQWGTSLPVDPGEHVFEARAPGRKTWSSTVNVKGEGATIDVAIPALEDEPVAPPAPVVASPALSPRSPELAPSPRPTTEASDGSRTLWIAIAGSVGIVATGLAIGFGVSAGSRWDDAERACPDNRCRRAADLELGDQAGTRADVSTALFIVGGLGLATAATLWLTAPNTSSKQGVRVVPQVGAGGGGLVVGGTL